jgi:membrane-associated phospholipid phosphatase
VRALHARILARRWALLGLFAGILAPLVVFGDLAEDVWRREGFAWDGSVLWAIHAHANPTLDTIMVLITDVGAPLPMIAFVAVLLGVLLWRSRYGDAFCAAVAVGGAALLNLLAKALFQRHRPELWPQLTPETDYGFPSGHAMGSLGVVATLVLVLWPTRWRWPALGGGAVFVCWSGSRASTSASTTPRTSWRAGALPWPG